METLEHNADEAALTTFLESAHRREIMKKNTQKFDPFANLILDEEEQLIEQALENDEFVNRPDFEDTKKMLEEAASRHINLNKSKSITLRIN